MNNKGFTLIELIVSFVLTSIISFFLFEIIYNLKQIEENTSVKTNLLTKQSIISNRLNDKLNTKSITNIEKCSDIQNNCLNFVFSDNSSTKIVVDSTTNTISIDKDKIKILESAEIGNMKISIYHGNEISDKKDSMFNMKIPINHSDFTSEDFGLNIVYQYNHQNMNIDNLASN